MEPDEVLKGLREKRLELTQQLEEIDRERQQILQDVASLDHAAAVFDPSARDTKGRLRDGHVSTLSFQRHELSQLLGDALRKSGEPLAAAEIAAAIADQKAVPSADRETRRWLASRVSVALNALERSGAVVGDRTSGDHRVRWRLARARLSSRIDAA